MELRMEQIFGSGSAAPQQFRRRAVPPQLQEFLQGLERERGLLPPVNPQVDEAAQEKEAKEKALKKFKDNALKQFVFLLDNPDETLADCKIISSDGKEFQVHKVMLIARSPVFQAMLTCGMKEAQSGIIHVEDLSSKAIKFLLHFMYTCEMLPFSTNSPEKDDVDEDVCVSEILMAASKYQVMDLMEYFDLILGGTLCTEANAMFLLTLANKYVLKKAQENIQDFIMKRPKLNKSILGAL